jgi:hypothetical protein
VFCKEKFSEIVKLTHYRTLKALAAQHLPHQPQQPFNCSTVQTWAAFTGVIALPKRRRFSLISVRILCHAQKLCDYWLKF